MKARESNIGICVHGQHSNRRWKGNDRMLHRGDCETMSEENNNSIDLMYLKASA